MAVRQAAEDLETPVFRREIPPETSADQVDEVRRQVGKIAGSVTPRALSPRENRDRHAAVGSPDGFVKC
jgi:hypothetical protein